MRRRHTTYGRQGASRGRSRDQRAWSSHMLVELLPEMAPVFTRARYVMPYSREARAYQYAKPITPWI